MKTLIIYSTSYGYTSEVVARMARQLLEVTAINIVEDKTVDLDAYDQVILGGSIYVGRVHKDLAAFIKNNQEKLLNKPLKLFLCCAFEAKFQEDLALNFSPELLAHAQKVENFGGRITMDKLSFGHKIMAKMVAKTPEGKQPVNAYPERVEAFLA